MPSDSRHRRSSKDEIVDHCKDGVEPPKPSSSSGEQRQVIHGTKDVGKKKLDYR